MSVGRKSEKLVSVFGLEDSWMLLLLGQAPDGVEQPRSDGLLVQMVPFRVSFQ